MTQKERCHRLHIPSSPFRVRASKSDLWTVRAARTIQQEPLFITTLSMKWLSQVRQHSPPAAIFMGLGLCSRQRMSVLLPVDILGLLLPAERLRRALGAQQILVEVADVHALHSGWDPYIVEKKTRDITQTLELLRSRLGLKALSIIRASEFQSSMRYREILNEVCSRAPRGASQYFKREIADVAYLNRRLGGILKIGWAIDAKVDSETHFDELAFDQKFNAWRGEDVPFVYVKAGRVLDDKRPKASPYVVGEPWRRICLHPDENVTAKLKNAASYAAPETINGMRNYLRSVTRIYSAIVARLNGPLEERTQHIIGNIFENRSRRIKPSSLSRKQAFGTH